jgi:predicted XRE-type DNA-binding protein
MASRRVPAQREELIKKAVLAKEIARILKDRRLTQTEAANIIRDAPSQISLMVTGKLRGFSTERLTRTLTRLGRDVEITVRRARGRTGKVRLLIR